VRSALALQHGTRGQPRGAGQLPNTLRRTDDDSLVYLAIIWLYSSFMRHEIVLAPSAVRELRALPPYVRTQVRDALERHLRHEPTRLTRSRIKRLRGLEQPRYRLRIGDVRVFYDVAGDRVEVLAVVSKAQADAWLQQEERAHEEGGAGEG
jgi:mRNA-degrading endonuclease RelE of RelBE toxin-antitoxin system